jgi:hypothetical protein
MSANMIFGFNTDIKVQGTVYHVQTEVREQERRLESQVFVSGRCIGVRSSPLPAEAAEEATREATQEAIQEMARAQHRWVVEAVREGFVDDVLVQEGSEELVVQFLGSQRISGKDVVLRFRVLVGGHAAASARVSACWKIDSSAEAPEGTHTNDAGVAEMHLTLAHDPAELEVRAHLEGRETARRFLVKSAKK